jgi:pimeloyl-ACP methyl ester carboxylesterase
MSASLPELDEVGGVALTHHYITVADDVVLHVVEAGGRSGEGVATVCFLHGFPDFWLSWRRQSE